jgi:hypothetical protein
VGFSCQFAKQFHGHVMQQCGGPLLLVPAGCFPHTSESPGHALTNTSMAAIVPVWARVTRLDGPVIGAKLIELFARVDPKEFLAGGRRAAFETGPPWQHQPEPCQGIRA